MVAVTQKRLVETCCGSFSVRNLFPLGKPGNLLFEPMDSRVPRVLIPIDSLSEGQIDIIKDSLQAKTLYEVAIKKWEEGSIYITGELLQSIGDPSELDNLIVGILINYGIDRSEIDTVAETELPPADFTIPPEEMARRRDFRHGTSL